MSKLRYVLLRDRLNVQQLEAREVPAILTLSPASGTLNEHAGPAGATLVTLTRSDTDLSQSMTVSLASSDTSDLTVPATATFPAGAGSITFLATPVDDTLTDGSQPVTITATLNGPVTGYSGELTLDSTIWRVVGFNGGVTMAGVAVQPDNKILMATSITGASPNLSDFRVSRHLANGTLDFTFGGGTGMVRIEVSGLADKAEAIVVQPDGKILIVGTGGNSPTFDFVFARLNSNGSLDTTFGNGGKLFLDMGTGFLNEIWDVALQGDGKIVVAGNVNGAAAVTRLNSDGTLDASFDGDGTALIPFGATAGSRLFAVALQADNKIVVAGDYGGGSSASRYSLARLNTDGSLDATFGNGGMVLTDFVGQFDNAQDVVLLPNGKIVVVGQVGRNQAQQAIFDIGIARYNTDGTPDASFGTNGQLIQTNGSGYSTPVRALVQPTDGRLVVSATTGTSANNVRGQIFRYSPAGVLENSKLTTYIGSLAENLAVDSNGTIYFAFNFNTGAYVERFTSVAISSPLATGTTGLTVADNEPFSAIADAYSISEDGVLTVPASAGFLANDIVSNPISPQATKFGTGAGNPTHGTLALNDDGSFTYTPNPNYNGTDSSSYHITDGNAVSNIVTVTYNVIAVNDPPVANNDQFTTDEDVFFSGGLLVNDSDVEGQPLTASLVSQPDNGFVTLDANGAFSYIPKPNFNGTDTFTYKVNDGSLDSPVATVTMTVRPAADAPSSIVDGFALNEDASLPASPDRSVLANDTDADGDPLTATLVSGPAHGSVNFNADGTFSYTPLANHNGDDTFTYKAFDGALYGPVTTVTLIAFPVNDAPVALDDAYATDEDQALTIAAPGVLANDSDVDGDSLTPTLVTGPAHGTLVFNGDGSFTYSPVANFNGSDSFTYTVSDGALSGGPATVSITVNAVNDAPVSNGDAYATTEDTSLVVPASLGLLANDSDIEGDSLTAFVVTGPANGSLSLNPDGSFSYVPVANFNGSDSFTYQAFDGAVLGPVTTVQISVGSVNDAPVANDDSVTTNEDTPLSIPAPGVFANDFDADGDLLTVTKISNPSHGAVVLNGDGSFTYTPAANFFGTDSFAYQLSDGVLSSAVATVTITVNPVNDVPVASDDSYTVREDGTLVAGPASPLPTPALAYSFDESASGVTPALDSGLAPATSGSFVGVATRTAGGIAGSPTAALSLVGGSGQVTPGVATDLNALSSMTLTMWVNVRDAALPLGGKRLIGTAPANPGSPPTGTRTWYLGFDDFNLGGSRAARFRPTFGVAESSVGGNYGATAMTSPDTLDASQKWVFLAISFEGGWIPNSSLVTMYAGGSGAEVAMLNIGAFNGSSLNGFNPQNLLIGDPTGDLPVWIDDVRIYSQALGQADVERIRQAGTAQNVAGVLANDTDPEGSALGATVVTTPAHGSVALGSDGRFVYIPEANYNGPDSFTYQVNDGTDNGNVATVRLNVTPVNDAPKLYSVSYRTTPEDTPITFASPNNFLLQDVDSATSSSPLKLTVDFLQGSGKINLTSVNGATVTGNNSTAVTVQGTVAQINATLNTLKVTPVANSNDSFAPSPTLRLTVDDQANGGTGAQVSSTWGGFGVTPVNDAPGFNAGSNQTVDEDSGPRTIANWLTGINAGPADESGQSVSFEVVGNSNAAMFSSQPTIDSTGTLRYTPAPNANGSATISYRARDNGGTTDGGIDFSVTRTATITVVALPDASAIVNGGEAQRSRVTKITVTFDGLMDRTLLSAAAFTLRRVGNNATVGSLLVALSTVNGNTVATITFSGANTQSGSLIDGRWTFTVLASRVRSLANGRFMIANFVLNTHRLFGDADGDADVDTLDRTAFNTAYGSNSNQAAYRQWFDFDLNGVINNSDRSQFNSRYGTSI